MASKTQVAPLDTQTIPLPELLSNLTASRLVKSVSQALENVVKVDDVVNWTDSMISLWWIRNTDKEYKQFVENRVSEIRRNAPPEQWRTVLRQKTRLTLHQEELKPLHSKKAVCGYMIQNSGLRKVPTGQSNL